MKGYEDFYYNLPEKEKQIVSALRNIILEVAPNLTEKLAYKVPYYYQYYRVCFIWPASVKPGPKFGVVMGFCKGYLLSNDQGLLEKENRKEVYMIPFHSVKEINKTAIREILIEALMLDKELSKNKRK